jgi:hypothetical protein
MHPASRILVCTIILLSACNLPQKAAQPTLPPATLTGLPEGGPAVVIISPLQEAHLPAGAAVQVQFGASGGPFIEADMSVDHQPTASLALAQDDPAPSGTLTWSAPEAGTHTLTVQVLTPEKQLYTASIQVVVDGGQAAATTPDSAAADPDRESARQQVIQIMRDTYHIDLSAPPVIHKARQGVSNDPWASVIFSKNWMYSILIYPDRVVESPHPIDQESDGSVPVPPDQKAFPVCRPAGTLKILVALVDFQNLGVTKAQALDALAQTAAQLNTELAHYSTLGGAKTPILQLQVDGVFLSPAPAMPDHLLTPEIVKSAGGVDPAQYDLLVQVDLDADNTYRKVLIAQNFDTYGFTLAACHAQGLSIWISLESQDQVLGQDADTRLKSTLSHELLHTFGYPFEHSWPCGEGIAVDGADQCDIGNWPTLILGWTDTDGDSIPEIIDPNPYGSVGP